MSEIFEIAYAAASKRLCFFTGTGFSKAITEESAPSWQGLLKKLCRLLPSGKEIEEALFPIGEPNPLSLEEAAQVISIELQSIDKNIYDEVAGVICKVKLSGDNQVIADFFSSREFRVVTTNYDKLAEELVGVDSCQSIAPGLPIPKSSASVKVYHVHGSVDSPSNMVVTSEDYFKFINNHSYFSRKLSTVLHENTVVILGYSLSDTNLKAIINDYKGFSKSHVIGSNIFLVSRSKVNRHVKDYYSHCYGIRVLDGLEVHDFFSELNESIPRVEKIIDRSLRNIRDVVYGGKKFKGEYLKLEDSFAQIVSSLSAAGLSLADQKVVRAIGGIIDAKRELTAEHNAWEQYEHLARWLIYFGTIFEIKGTSIEKIYLAAVLRSMDTMSKKLIIGYSWYAYKSWMNRWPSLISSNRALIKRYIEEKSSNPDALMVVNSI